MMEHGSSLGRAENSFLHRFIAAGSAHMGQVGLQAAILPIIFYNFMILGSRPLLVNGFVMNQRVENHPAETNAQSNERDQGFEG